MGKQRQLKVPKFMGLGASPAAIGCTTWEEDLHKGYRKFLEPIATTLGDKDNHFVETPERIVRALKAQFHGVRTNPADCLKTSFSESQYDQMIWVKDIPFVSYCRHHLLPFFGKIHFAYLPHERIVGLSKIPRFIRVLCARPQLQENLAEEIVTIFQKEIKPLGCGVVIEARHCCMFARGVEKDAVTRTVALRKEFLKQTAKIEFLEGVK